MTSLTADDVRTGRGRLPIQEAMGLVSLPDRMTNDGKVERRFMSRRAAWTTGEELVTLAMEHDASAYKSPGTGAYGGHVYCQSSLAASLAFRAATQKTNAAAAARGGRDKKFGIHTIHGFFSEGGLTDRPFIYSVTELASNASFPSFLVTARQPTTPSTTITTNFEVQAKQQGVVSKPKYYPVTEADKPLGPVCFSAMVSFRPAGISQLDTQPEAPQARFAAILNSRQPAEWDPAPIVDIASILDSIPNSRRAIGMFPGVEMRKVDMRAYNASRPFHERRELLLYRLIAPLPSSPNGSNGSGDAKCEIAGPDAHIATHAFAADRNGLLMIGDNAGWGYEFSRAASLSYSFVVHVNAEDAVMVYGEEDQWWIQETSFPRVRDGRGIVYSKIWSPRGVHVATEYQDGIMRRSPRSGEDRGKL